MLTYSQSKAINDIKKRQERKFDIRDTGISDEELEAWSKSFGVPEAIDVDFFSEVEKLVEAYKDITYSDELIDLMYDKFKFLPKQMYKREGTNGVELYIIVRKADSVMYAIEEVMKQHGYFVSYKSVKENQLVIVFESYTSLDATKDVRMLDVLYHYTKEKNVESILNNGLKPRSMNNWFSFPDRVYLSLKENEKLAKRLKSFAFSNDDYVCLEIDVKKIPEEVKFYYDCMTKDSVYSTELIPAGCIKRL